MPEPVDASRTQTNAPSVGGDTDETSSVLPANPPPGPPFAPPAERGEVGTLGPYRVLKRLGQGGMGAVYLAVDTRLNRKLALKVMLPQFAANPVARERFVREARAAAQITHDNVVTVYEADERDGVPYIAMQLLQGYPLDEYLRKKGNPTVPQVLRVAREVAEGLAAAHALGLVHRDIKPANLWLEAPNGRVKVLDFGLARPVDADGELTRRGAVLGTPAFMSPEQARGEKVDHRTDLYSLGAVLYKLGTGKLPAPAFSTQTELSGSAELTPVRELNPEVPEALAELIHQLLAADPDHRPQSADEVAKRARTIADQSPPPTVLPPGTQPQVVYVPIHVTAPPEEANAFADLGATEAEVVSPIAVPGATPPEKRRAAGTGVWLSAGFAILLAVGAVGGVVALRNKGGTADTNATPAKSAGPVQNAGPSPPGPDRGATAPSPPDPDRTAAEYVLSLGGRVTVNGMDSDIASKDHLPNQPFRLTQAVLSGKAVTDVGMVNFKGCRGLHHLRLASTKLTDEGLAPFAGYAGFSVLDLNKTGVTDVGLAHLRNCKNLTSLHLAETAITDAGLAHFKGFKAIRALDFSGTGVTDEGLANFTESKFLVTLNLSRTSVSNAGLALFKDCKGLTTLDVRKTGITEMALAEFHAAVPGCRIVHDGGVIAAVVPPLDPAWVAKVRALPVKEQVAAVAEELKRRNPGFDPVLHISAKIEPAGLTYLHVVTEEVTDVTPVRAFNKLERLNLGARYGDYRSKLADLRPLYGLSLRELNLMSAPGVTDLSLLKGMPLETLTVSATGVADFGPLAGAPLKELNCTHMPALKSLESLRGFKLEKLNFSHSRGVEDLSPLEGMPLTVLWFYNTGVKDLTPLAKSPLVELSCGNGTRVTDLSPLKGMKTLRRLYVDQCPVADLRPLAGMALEHLHISNKVTDFTPIKGMPLVEVLGPFDPKRDAELLKSIPTLKKINGKPAEDFWKP